MVKWRPQPQPWTSLRAGRLRRSVGTGLLCVVTVVPARAPAQTAAIQARAPRPDSEAGTLILLDARMGYMITAGQGFTNRPFGQVDGGVQFGPARVGSPPALALTLGVAAGAGQFLARGSTVSLRVLAGIELPWAVAAPVFGAQPLEIVPAVQAGYQNAFGEDERSGLTLRGALGLRLLPGAGTFFFTFEPASLVLLPRPSPLLDKGSSRFAAELGILKFGWRF